MLKREMETKLYEMRREVERLQAELLCSRATVKALAADNREYTDCGKVYVPVCLTNEQAQSVKEIVQDRLSRCFGDGEWIEGNYETEGVYKDHFFDSDILPGFGGFVGQGYSTYENGWNLDSVWGLVQVPSKCRTCGAPQMDGYNCSKHYEE